MSQPKRFQITIGKPKRTTPAAIKAAADQVLAAGQHVTVDTVRAVLGVGSLSTISRILKDWHRERQQTIGRKSGVTAELVGDQGVHYLVSKNFVEVNGRRIASIVLNSLHLLIDAEEAARLIESANAYRLGKRIDNANVEAFSGEALISIRLADAVKFTAAPEFATQLAQDLRAALDHR